MTCPICGKPPIETARPFCSKRCADLDLARWFNGSYAVASENPDDADALQEAIDAEREEQSRPKPH
ncbi:DNA gyrase inhibitor YacG [Roseobacter litoralis]|uniref:DNA gyrase inhibitor YacG n=1 Tax=Roseobacter litoralis TaxID=42443 RepID=UPI000160E185|nr:DNA gyrase inhibitor YacG [Roseobacter litoralis]